MRSADAFAAAGHAVATLLRIETRRPAAWVTLGVAGGGGAWLPAAAAAPLAAALGGLLAVAAIGHLPGRGGRVAPAAWSSLPWVRVAGPVAGGALAAAGLALRGNVGPALAAVGLAASGLVTAAVFAACVGRGGIEAVAASRALAINGLGAAAGVAVMVAGGSPAAQVAAILAAWGLAAAGYLAGQVHERPTSLGVGGHRRPLAGSGPAMASALAGMAGCYFLAPQFAWAYAWIAVGWFVALAVPAATPPSGRAATVRLVRSAVGRPAVPASSARAVSLVAMTAGLLAWPAVVAAVLAGPEVRGAGGPLAALAALAVAAGLTVVGATIAAIASGLRSSGELARAVLLSAAAMAAIGAAAWAAGPPAAPGLPSLSAGCGPWALQTGVEARRASCQTSQLTQMPRSDRRERQTVSSRQASAADTRAFRSCRS